jgi:hypothetical protein
MDRPDGWVVDSTCSNSFIAFCHARREVACPVSWSHAQRVGAAAPRAPHEPLLWWRLLYYLPRACDLRLSDLDLRADFSASFERPDRK